jgi:hypothetical protein
MDDDAKAISVNASLIWKQGATLHPLLSFLWTTSHPT